MLEQFWLLWNREFVARNIAFGDLPGGGENVFPAAMLEWGNEWFVPRVACAAQDLAAKRPAELKIPVSEFTGASFGAANCAVWKRYCCRFPMQTDRADQFAAGPTLYGIGGPSGRPVAPLSPGSFPAPQVFPAYGLIARQEGESGTVQFFSIDALPWKMPNSGGAPITLTFGMNDNLPLDNEGALRLSYYFADTPPK